MELTFLGTSGCIPTKYRGLSAIHIDYLGETMLFDCGEGTQRQMRCGGLNFMHLTSVFITHHHADHFMGLGGMLQSMDFLERETPLLIYGPLGTEELVNKILSLGSFQLDYLKVVTKDVCEGEVHRGERYTVSAYKTVHSKTSLGYVFTEDPHRVFQRETALKLGVPEGILFSKLSAGETVDVKGKTITPDMVLAPPILGRKVVITGDTRPCRATVDAARDADILVHEAMFSEIDKDATQDAAHSTTVDAAKIAAQADVKKLYLTHISQRYTDPEVLEAEAQGHFPASYVASDLLKVKIEKHW